MNDQWILTASRCIDTDEDIIVQAGNRFLDGKTETNAQIIEVEEKVFLEDADMFAPALLKLRDSLEFNPVTQSIPLSFVDNLDNPDKITFTGWGPTLLFQNGQSNTLKAAEKIVDNCDYDNSFCAKGDDGNACIVSKNTSTFLNIHLQNKITVEKLY